MKPCISTLTSYCSALGSCFCFAFNPKIDSRLDDEYFLADTMPLKPDPTTRSLKSWLRYWIPLPERCVSARIETTPRNRTREPYSIGGNCVALDGTNGSSNSVRSKLRGLSARE